MSSTFRSLLLALGLALASSAAQAALNVLACEPEWADLATRLGGDRVRVTSATTGLQDPHHVEARPSLIARTRNADLLACTGMELEAGWLPALLEQSGNARVAPGRPGFFEAGRFVAPLEVPAQVDRSQGDVHAQGNPHVHLDPRNVARVADALARRLAELDPEGASSYASRHQAFAAQWAEAQRRWQGQGAALKGVAFIEHHRNLSYLASWLGMRSEGSLEPKPGIEPSAAHLNGLLKGLGQRPVRFVAHMTYQDARAAQWLGTNAKLPVVALPMTVGGSDKAKDLFSLYDDILSRLAEAVK
jgi:zinc/manganese transport system substrate-binding protein